jgi:hypothetical protein
MATILLGESTKLWESLLLSQTDVSNLVSPGEEDQSYLR